MVIAFEISVVPHCYESSINQTLCNSVCILDFSLKSSFVIHICFNHSARENDKIRLRLSG